MTITTSFISDQDFLQFLTEQINKAETASNINICDALKGIALIGQRIGYLQATLDQSTLPQLSEDNIKNEIAEHRQALAKLHATFTPQQITKNYTLYPF